ncbi:hypothetical protein [Halocatena marina]|uniref:hypothetical protein n=1 Tax=Halocatena marina TaxID=2934937 RepID=UPI00200E023F|nr:hypothetical protein [Halocatena marina]
MVAWNEYQSVSFSVFITPDARSPLIAIASARFSLGSLAYREGDDVDRLFCVIDGVAAGVATVYGIPFFSV